MAITHRSYSRGEEPTGHFDTSGLDLSNLLSINVGNFKAALKAAVGDHPGYALWKIRVPVAYRDEAEILEWRDYFHREARAFFESDFDPRQAFDGLTAFRTLELCYQQLDDRDILEEIGTAVYERISKRALPDLSEPIEGERRPGKLRIGFISESFHFGVCAPWVFPWLVHKPADVETYIFHLGRFHDGGTEKFKAVADHYVHMPGDSAVPSEARHIRSLDLDALIFLDIAQTGRQLQFGTLRLARHQCVAWGAAETSGLPTMDAYLSSDWMEPADADKHYTERLIRLPKSGMTFVPGLPAATHPKSHFGLDDGPLYLSCQSACKILPRYDEIYKRINERTGRPIVFIWNQGAGAPVVQRRLTKAGVNAIFLPAVQLTDFLALLRCADVCLDTVGWNGGITSMEALAFKTPIVTLPTDLKRGRHTLAFLRASNAMGMVAKDVDDYVELVANAERRKAAMADMDPAPLFTDLEPIHALYQFLRTA